MIAHLLFFSLFYIAGFAILGLAAWWGYRSHLAAHWPIAQGSIRHLLLHQHAGPGQAFTLDIEYSYTVDGVSYTSTRITFGRDGSQLGNRLTVQLHHRLKRASSVGVRYNPADPSECCLTFGWHKGLQVQAILGLITLVFISGLAVGAATATGPDAVLLDNLSVP